MRRLFNISAGFSFLLFALLIGLWVRSFFAFDGVLHFGKGGDQLVQVTVSTPAKVDGKEGFLKGTTDEKTLGRLAGVVSRRGMISYVNVRVPDDRFKTWVTFSDSVSEPKLTPAKMTVNAMGRGSTIGTGTAHFIDVDLIEKRTFDWVLPCWRLTVPYAALAILAAVLPYFWIARFRLMARREREGLCLECGHDVKGRTGKCPGCGAEIPAD